MITKLVLNIAPELEEDLIDYLLSLDAVTGFTSYEARGHGHNADMSLAEQVSGRRKRLQFELLIEEIAIAGLLSNLSIEVGKDINYWQETVTNFGRVE